MEMLEAFERMLDDILHQAEREKMEMEKPKAAGREKSATYRQYLGNRLFYKMISVFDRSPNRICSCIVRSPR